MKHKILALILLINMVAFSQKRDLGEVTVAELSEKVCPTDTSAAAAILFNLGEVKFDFSESSGFSIVTKVRTKIKIYKKEGYDWANKAVRYYIGDGGKEKLFFNNAATYNLVDGKVVKTKLKSDGEFEEKVNKYWGRKKITLPNIKEGSIIEFEYNLTSTSFGALDEWDFQYSIPVLYSEYKTIVPEFYTYKPLMRGYFAPKVTTEKTVQSIGITDKTRVSDGRNTVTNYSNDKFNFTETKSVYLLTNIPALKDEGYVNNIKNYISSIEHELLSIQYPNEPVRTFSTDWETVVKKIYENDNFGTELNKTGYFEKDIDVIITGKTTPAEKAAAIFEFVKSKMNWNEFYGYSCDGGVRKAYTDKVGNVAEINLMLTSMFRYAGLNANPVLVSTRGNGVSLAPSRTAFDYVISGVEVDGGIVLFDATSKYALPNILPIRNLNWFGRIIRKDGSSSEVNLMPTSNSKDIINLMAEIKSDGEVTGKLREQYLDYNAFSHRERNNQFSKESMIEKLEKRYKGVELADYEVQNIGDLSKPVVENYAFTSTNLVEIIGDKIYFSPLLFLAMTENPFKQESREYPVDFVYPNQDKINISIKIPEGYVVETLPEPKSVAMPDDLASLKYTISSNGSQVQVLYTLDINQAIVNSDYYEALKNFFKEVVDKHTEKVVLKKG